MRPVPSRVIACAFIRRHSMAERAESSGRVVGRLDDRSDGGVAASRYDRSVAYANRCENCLHQMSTLREPAGSVPAGRRMLKLPSVALSFATSIAPSAYVFRAGERYTYRSGPL